jgi:hypothetical protein
MAESVLVGPDISVAQRLTKFLDESGTSPRAVVWAYESDRKAWRLWVVPPAGLGEKREFYLRLADVYAAHSGELAGFDLGEVQFVRDDHPAIRGLAAMFRLPGVNDAIVSDNVLNGYYLPDAIVIRMDL